MADQQVLHFFGQWVAGCSGNEKQEAQTFVQKLLTDLGWEDATEVGVSFEHKIPKGGAGPSRWLPEPGDQDGDSELLIYRLLHQETIKL